MLSRRVASRRVASRRVASRRVASRRVASRRVASRRVASRRVDSARIAGDGLSATICFSRYIHRDSISCLQFFNKIFHIVRQDKGRLKTIVASQASRLERVLVSTCNGFDVRFVQVGYDCGMSPAPVCIRRVHKI